MSETNFNPFDEASYSKEPTVQVESEVSPETEVNTSEQKTEAVQSEVNETTQVESTPETVQENVQESVQEEVESQPIFEWPNETAKDIYDKLVSGNISELADIIYEQKVLSSLDSMDDVDVVKLKMAYDYPELTPEEIEEEFASKFSIDNNVDTSLMSDEELAAHNRKMEKAARSVMRELKKDAGSARQQLSSYKQEISFPDILSQVQSKQESVSPEDVLNEFFQVQEAEQSKAYEQARSQYISSLSDGLKQFDGFSVNYKDEDVQFDGKFNVTPEEKQALQNSLNEFDLEDFYGARYYKDGKYDTKQLAEDVYFLQNRDKIMNSLVTQAVSKAKSDLLKSMKNIDFNDTPRVGASAGSNNDYDAMVAKLFSI